MRLAAALNKVLKVLMEPHFHLQINPFLANFVSARTFLKLMIQLLKKRLAVILQLRNEGNNYCGYSFSSMGTENPWGEQFNSLITMVSAKEEDVQSMTDILEMIRSFYLHTMH